MRRSATAPLVLFALATNAAVAAHATPMRRVAGWERVRIEALTCGDNCYLDIRDARGRTKEVMCTVDLCNRWFGEQALPSRVRGRPAMIRMGTAAQVDGAGNVVNPRFPAIINMRLLGR